MVQMVCFIVFFICYQGFYCYKYLRDFDAGYSCYSGIPDKPINLSTSDKPLPVNLINPEQLDKPSTV